MNTSLTVSDVRRSIGMLFNPNDFTGFLNRGLERIVNSGLWKGTISYAGFPSVNNTFALPYEFLTVIGAQWFRCPVPVFGQFHDFIIGGPGQPIVNLPPEGIVEDLGDGYPTQVEIPTDESTLEITLDSASDAGKIVRFNVLDENDRKLNFNVTLTYPTTTIAQQCNEIQGIQGPVNADNSSDMVGGWTLTSIAPDLTETELSYYYPNESRPSYRRYRIGVTDATNTQVPNAVTVLVRKRFIPVFKETDWVIPGNIGALTFAMQAIDNESSKNDASDLWAKCFEILNQELHALRGAARPEVAYETFGSFGGLGNCW